MYWPLQNLDALAQREAARPTEEINALGLDKNHDPDCSYPPALDVFSEPMTFPVRNADIWDGPTSVRQDCDGAGNPFQQQQYFDDGAGLPSDFFQDSPDFKHEPLPFDAELFRDPYDPRSLSPASTVTLTPTPDNNSHPGFRRSFEWACKKCDKHFSERTALRFVACRIRTKSSFYLLVLDHNLGRTGLWVRRFKGFSVGTCPPKIACSRVSSAQVVSRKQQGKRGFCGVYDASPSYPQTNYPSRKHLRYHVRPYSCVTCQMDFSVKKDLRRHQQTRGHGGQGLKELLSCPVEGCSFKFKACRNDTYKRHCRLVHGVRPSRDAARSGKTTAEKGGCL